MNPDERKALIRLRDHLSLELINLDAMLETDAKYKAQVEDYHKSVRDLRDRRERDRRAAESVDDLWGAINFSTRVNNEDGA